MSLVITESLSTESEECNECWPTEINKIVFFYLRSVLSESMLTVFYCSKLLVSLLQ